MDPFRTTVVVCTQELAGIDAVSDGELSRFDVKHPEANGMIEYFVNPLGGVSTRLTRAEIEEFRGLKPSIVLGLGVIDIKDNEVESPDAVAAVIERAVKVLG